MLRRIGFRGQKKFENHWSRNFTVPGEWSPLLILMTFQCEIVYINYTAVMRVLLIFMLLPLSLILF